MDIQAKFDHFNINVTDLERSIAFYEKALGLKPCGEINGPEGAFKIVYLGNELSPFRGSKTTRNPTTSGNVSSTSASECPETMTPPELSTKKWDASATKTTTWDSISSPTRTATGLRCCP